MDLPAGRNRNSASYRQSAEGSRKVVPKTRLTLDGNRVMIPSLTLNRIKNSHNPSVYQGCGCFLFCIDMYYF